MPGTPNPPPAGPRRRLEPRSFVLGFLAALALTGGLAVAQGSLDDVVLAIVNGEKVTRARLVSRLLEYHGQDALEKMTNRVLLMQYVDRLKVSVTKEELDTRSVQIRARFGGEENYQKFLPAGGLTEAQHREQTQYTMLLEKAALKQTPITDSDLDRYLVRVIVGVDEKSCEAVIAKLKEGNTDFRELAFAFSTDKQSAEYGGLIPPFLKIDYPEMWRAMDAQKLKPGEFTQKPTFVGSSYLVIKFEKILPAKDLSKAERESLETRLTGFRMDQFLSTITETSKISYPVPLESVIEAAKNFEQQQRAAAD